VLQLNFNNPVDASDIVVVMVAYVNKANRKHISIINAPGTWTDGYAPGFKGKFGMAVFFGTGVTGLLSLQISVPQLDQITAYAQEWSNLSAIEDKRARSYKIKTSSTPNITIKTKNANDVIFNVFAFSDPGQASPPTGSFLFFGTAGNTRPYLTGGYLQTTVKGKYTNSFIFNHTGTPFLPTAVHWASIAFALETSPGPNQLFTATPLTDFAPGELYLSTFPGLLYNGANTLPPTDQHDIDGRAIATAMQPLDANGNPSLAGKIVMLGMGPSNFTEELCTGSDIVPNPLTGSGAFPACEPNTFIDQVGQLQSAGGLNPNLQVVDCAKGGQFIENWLDVTSTAWTTCLQTRLQPNVYNVTPQQVQALVFMDDDNANNYPNTLNNPTVFSSCPAPLSPPGYSNIAPNACAYEYSLGLLMRLLKIQFPNLKMVFLQARTYAGYATKEPRTYENGFSVKWLIQAQINQMATGAMDTVAGDLGYLSSTSTDNATAWVGWGPYT
jgi:hypothetical protein